MATILEFESQAATSLATALGSHSVVVKDAADVVQQASTTGDTLVVIGPSVSDSVAARVTGAIVASFPNGGVIWCRRRVDTTTVLAAVRAGAADVVAEADLPALVHAATRVVERANRMSSQPGDVTSPTSRATVTAVYSAKGGCGKTSIACNTAAIMAAEMSQRVCLLDLDLESGDIQLLAALPPARTVLDLVDLEASLDSISLTACMQQHASGMYVLAAPRRPEEAAGITPSLISKLLTVASGMFDQIVIDCPPYATEHVLTVFDNTDRIGLICTPDAASVKNTAIALEVFDELSVRAQVDLIINHAGDKVGITTADIAEALQKEVACEIPSSLDMPLSTNSAQLLALSHANHLVTNSIRGWAHEICPPPAQSAPVPAQRSESAKPKRQGLFRKRVVSA